MFLNLVFKLHILDINTIHTRWICPGSLGRALLDVPKSSLTFKFVIIIKKYLLLLKSSAGGDPPEGKTTDQSLTRILARIPVILHNPEMMLEPSSFSPCQFCNACCKAAGSPGTIT